jgi:serine/threonine-protein kinase
MICPSCNHENEMSADVCFTCGHRFASATSLTRGAVVAGRYEILARIGSGGMGVVFKAHDRALDELAALKVLRPDVAHEPILAKRLRTEIKLARRILHPNVCRIHDFGQDGELSFISMEYVDGADLRRLMRGQPFETEVAFETCDQLAQGLAAIHRAKIVHRDLKTANVMRDTNGIVKLMDFGIAKQIGGASSGGATATGQIIGTPQYMSPEQAQGEVIDARSDVYALAIVVFEIFTAKLPFEAETPVAVILKQIQETPPLDAPMAERIPLALRGVLKRALAKNREARYASADEMLVALRAAHEDVCPRLETAASPSAQPAGEGARTDGAALHPTPPASERPAVDRPSRAHDPGDTVVDEPRHATPVSPAVPVLRPRQPRPSTAPRPRAATTRRFLTLGLVVAAAACVIAVLAAGIVAFRWTNRRAPASAAGSTEAASSTPGSAGSSSPVPAGLGNAGHDAPGARRVTSAASSPAKSARDSGAPGGATLALSAPGPSPRSSPAGGRRAVADRMPTPQSRAGQPAPPTAEPTQATKREPTPSPTPPPTPVPTPPPTPAPAIRAPLPEGAQPVSAPAVRKGRFRLAVTPWARVTIDDKEQGTSPIPDVELPVGKHLVVLSHPHFRPLRRSFTIRAGETTTLTINLSEVGVLR